MPARATQKFHVIVEDSKIPHLSLRKMFLDVYDTVEEAKIFVIPNYFEIIPATKVK